MYWLSLATVAPVTKEKASKKGFYQYSSRTCARAADKLVSVFTVHVKVDECCPGRRRGGSGVANSVATSHEGCCDAASVLKGEESIVLTASHLDDAPI